MKQDVLVKLITKTADEFVENILDTVDAGVNYNSMSATDVMSYFLAHVSQKLVGMTVIARVCQRANTTTN